MRGSRALWEGKACQSPESYSNSWVPEPSGMLSPENMSKNMPSVYVKTLGCKVNTYDSHALLNQFKDRGYELSDGSDSADVTVVNTCSVTANADKEARYLARRLRRENPE